MKKFTLKSGNATSFKKMGSSPIKHRDTDAEYQAMRKKPMIEQKIGGSGRGEVGHKHPHSGNMGSTRGTWNSQTDYTATGNRWDKEGEDTRKNKKPLVRDKKSPAKQLIGGSAGEALAHHKKYKAAKEMDAFMKGLKKSPSIFSEGPKLKTYGKDYKPYKAKKVSKPSLAAEAKKTPTVSSSDRGRIKGKAKFNPKSGTYKQVAKKGPSVGKRVLSGVSKVVSKVALPLAIGEAMYSFYKEGKKRGFKPPKIKEALSQDSPSFGKYDKTKGKKNKGFDFNKK